MFKTQLALENWKNKYRFNSEEPICTWQRVAKALASVEDNPGDWEDKFLRTMVKFDIETDEPSGLKCTTGGRITANAGTSYNGATLVNCFSGSTEYLTKDGIKSLQSTVDSMQEIISINGKILSGKVKCFGKQPLNQVVFRPCGIESIYRNINTGRASNSEDVDAIEDVSYRPFRRSKYVVEELATLYHSWELVDGNVTERLKIGDYVPSNAPKFDINNDFYKNGFIHGVIFGDGTSEYKYVDSDQIKFSIRLCGDKSKFLPLFKECKYFESNKGDPVAKITTNINLKDLPSTFDMSYVKGFIDGYFEMDGSVISDQSIQISSINKSALEWVKRHSIYAGYVSFDIIKDKVEITNLGSRKLYRLNMTKSSNVVWKVIDILGGIDYSDVFCLDVPNTHRFTLSKGIYTSNCYINGPVKNATISYKRRSDVADIEYPVKIKTPDTPDNLNNIFLTILEQARTLASEGGYGINFSFIRPRGSIIKGIGIKHPGVPAYMSIWDSVSECIVQGDTDGYRNKIKNHLTKDESEELEEAVKAQARKGAMMGVLNVWHPDIEEYIRVKQESGKLQKFNMSVAVDDKFMQAVEENDFYNLVFGDKIYKRIKARELYNLIMESNYNRGEPGVLFVDNMHSNNPAAYLGKCFATNPSLHKDTFIITNKGAFPIGELSGEKDVEIINFKKEWQTCDIFKTGEQKQLYKIVFADNSFIYCTPEHKWPILMSRRIHDNYEQRKVDYTSFRKVRTDELKKNHKIYSPKIDEPFINSDCKFNHDDGFILGWNIGDGWKTWHKLHKAYQYGFIVNDDEEYIGKKISDYINNITSGEVNFRPSSSGKSSELCTSDSNVRSLFDEFGYISKEKGIPKSIWKGNAEFVSGFVDGLFSADGCCQIYNNRITLTSSRKSIADDIQKLLSFYGIQSKIRMSKFKAKFPNGKDYGKVYTRYDLVVRAMSNKRFAKLFTLSNISKNNILQEIKKHKVYGGDVEYKLIKNVGLSDVYEDVHDIRVHDDTHTFVCSGGVVTGNCGEIPGLADLTTVCLLGSLNVTQYVRIDRTFDFDAYTKDIEIFTRMLDNVNDLAKNPLPSYDWSVKNFRQIGMGLNGLGSAFVMMGISYNSSDAVNLAKKLCQLKENLTWRASALLAKEKGVYPAYDKEKFESTEYFKSDRLSKDTKALMRKYGVRNAKTTTNPPLGNSSVICDNVSNGIEPVVSLEYERIRITPNWPEGLSRDNVTELLKEYKEKDYSYWRGDYGGTIYHYEPHNRGLCDVTLVRDYGWQWVLDNVDKHEISRGVVTMSTLNVDDHLAIQEVVQYYCNQSVSKCLVEDQEIRTNFGFMKIVDTVDESVDVDGVGFYKCKFGLKVYNENGDYVDVESFYYGGVRPSYRVSFNNGMSIDFAENHLIKTTNGLVRAKNISENDIVNYKEYNLEMGSGGLPIMFDDNIFYNCIKRQFPKNMSVKLAKLLGMLISDGSIGKYSFSLIEKNKLVSKVYDDLCMDIFNIKPSVVTDKRNGVRSRDINSKPICLILHEMIGCNAFCKKISSQILNGSNDEKMAVLEGISLDGYYISDKNKLCLYNGVSEVLAKQIFNISVDLFGIGSCYYGYKKIKGYNHNSYYVFIDKSIKCIELHKNKVVTEWKRFVVIDKNEIKNKKMNYKDKNYNSFSNVKRRLVNKGQNKVSKFVADKLGLKYDSILYVVKNEYIGLKKVCDIAVKSDSHLYLVGNVITHNTINLPKNYSFTGFKNLYMEAWQRGLNGLTTYREGSMESVISSIEEAEETKGIIKTNIKLPETFLNGPTSVIKREGMKFYINFSYLPDDSDMKFPICMWIYTNSHPKGQAVVINKAIRELSKLSSNCGISSKVIDTMLEKADNDEYHNKLGRIISLCLRHNIPRARIYVALSNINGDNISSLLTSVRKYISNTIEDGTVLKGLKCPDCDSDNFVMLSGCKQCRDCGHSACG